MLDSIKSILATSAANVDVTNQTIVLAMCAAVILGFIISLCYLLTNQNAENRKSMAFTLIMLPAILAVIIIFVGSNIATAFSLAGTLGIIRFRSESGSPKDIGFIFFATGAGLACGVGMYAGGFVFSILLTLIIFLLEKLHYGSGGRTKSLKITIPEELDYESAFEDVFDKYAQRYTLNRVRTTELGSLFEVSYNVRLRKDVNEKMFLDELRCCNGNLTIVMNMGS